MSEQFAVEVIQESETDVIPADQKSIEDKADVACEGSIGSNKCIKTNGICYCFVTQQVKPTDILIK